MGQITSPGGRMGEPPSCAGLSHSLREVLGLKLGRLRTGTPPRIIKDTIDFSLAELHLPDPQPTPFSFINKHTHCKVKILSHSVRINILWLYTVLHAFIIIVCCDYHVCLAAWGSASMSPDLHDIRCRKRGMWEPACELTHTAGHQRTQVLNDLF